MQEIFAYIYGECIKNVSPEYTDSLRGVGVRVLIRGDKTYIYVF
jgi:hypothetical protein